MSVAALEGLNDEFTGVSLRGLNISDGIGDFDVDDANVDDANVDDDDDEVEEDDDDVEGKLDGKIDEKIAGGGGEVF